MSRTAIKLHLYEGVGVLVDVGRSLVHDEDLRPLQDGSGEAEKLPLTDLPREE